MITWKGGGRVNGMQQKGPGAFPGLAQDLDQNMFLFCREQTNHFCLECYTRQFKTKQIFSSGSTQPDKIDIGQETVV